MVSTCGAETLAVAEGKSLTKLSPQGCKEGEEEKVYGWEDKRYGKGRDKE